MKVRVEFNIDLEENEIIEAYPDIKTLLELALSKQNRNHGSINNFLVLEIPSWSNRKHAAINRET